MSNVSRGARGSTTPAPPFPARRRPPAMLAVAALIATVGGAPVASAQSTDDGSGPPSMAAAHQAYFAGEFTIAIARYEALADRGVLHEELFYNLGNAYFRASAGAADRHPDQRPVLAR